MVSVSGSRMASSPLSLAGPEQLVWAASLWTSSTGIGLSAQLAVVSCAPEERLAARIGAQLVLRPDSRLGGADSLRPRPRSGTQPSGVDPGRMRLRAGRLRRFHSRAADGQRSGLDAPGLLIYFPGGARPETLGEFPALWILP